LEPETTTLPEADELVYIGSTIGTSESTSDIRTSKTLGASGESETGCDTVSDSVSDDTENVSDSDDSTPTTTNMMIGKENVESTDTDDPGHGASSDLRVRMSDSSDSAHETTSDMSGHADRACNYRY
jgi:hypothetical protein